MPDEQPFLALLTRIREGDPHAAAELIKQYEPQLRIVARVKLRSNSLRRAVDSMDICQSVLGGFFCRVITGKLDLQSPEDVLNLLVVMVRNKIVDVARREGAGRRVKVRRVSVLAEHLALTASTSTPSEIVSAAELVEVFERHLSAFERRLRERKMSGATWEEIGRECGLSAEVAQKQYSRAMIRIAKEMRLS